MGSTAILGTLLFCLVLAVTDNAVISVFAVVCIRVGYSLLQPLQLEQQNRRIDTKYRATALSMNVVLMDSIAVFLNLLYGSAAEASLPGPMLLGALFCLVSMLLYRRSW